MSRILVNTLLACAVLVCPGFACAFEASDINSFMKLAIRHDVENYNNSAVLKWSGPISLGVFSVSQSITESMRDTVAEIKDAIGGKIIIAEKKLNFVVIGLDDIESKKSNVYANSVRGLFYSQESFQRFFRKNWTDGESCRGHIATSSEEKIQIVGAVIIVNNSAPELNARDCIIDGLLMILGLHPSTDRGLETAFDRKPLTRPYILADDLRALKVLYAETIPAGSDMNTINQALSKF